MQNQNALRNRTLTTAKHHVYPKKEMVAKRGEGETRRKSDSESPSRCHDVGPNVDTVAARSRDRGETSTLQALEPRALIPGTQGEKKPRGRLKTVTSALTLPFNTAHAR